MNKELALSGDMKKTANSEEKPSYNMTFPKKSMPSLVRKDRSRQETEKNTGQAEQRLRSDSVQSLRVTLAFDLLEEVGQSDSLLVDGLDGRSRR